MAVLKFRDENGNIIEVLSIKGDTYTLTEADKTDIADIVLENFTDVSEVGQ